MSPEFIAIVSLGVTIAVGFTTLVFMGREDRRKVREAVELKNREIHERQKEILDKLEPLRYFILHRHSERAGPLTREGMDVAE